LGNPGGDVDSSCLYLEKSMLAEFDAMPEVQVAVRRNGKPNSGGDSIVPLRFAEDGDIGMAAALEVTATIAADEAGCASAAAAAAFVARAAGVSGLMAFVLSLVRLNGLVKLNGKGIGFVRLLGSGEPSEKSCASECSQCMSICLGSLGVCLSCDCCADGYL